MGFVVLITMSAPVVPVVLLVIGKQVL
jgi:hypothetical protein